MKVFAIVVTYNPMKWIEKCLGGLEQSTSLVQTIVVDNNSTDGAVAYIKQNFPDVLVFENNINLGFGAANNIGIKKAYEDGADYVFLLNQDAWIGPDTIEKLILAQQKEPVFGVISPIHMNGSRDILDENFSFYINPSRCKRLYSDFILNSVKDELYEVEFVNAAAWLLSRECIERVGGFNPSFFHYGEDNNYCQRLRYHKLKVGILAKTIICHDRESCNDKKFIINEVVFYKRIVILKASNPLYEFSFQKEYSKRLKNILKSIVLLRFKELKLNFTKLKVLYKINKTSILKNRLKSRTEKLTFIS